MTVASLFSMQIHCYRQGRWPWCTAVIVFVAGLHLQLAAVQPVSASCPSNPNNAAAGAWTSPGSTLLVQKQDSSIAVLCGAGLVPLGATCVDKDECASGTHTCTPGQRCVNLLGSFSCMVDVDECSGASHNCHAHATCINTVGSFQCQCSTPYTGDGVTCSLSCAYYVGTFGGAWISTPETTHSVAMGANNSQVVFVLKDSANGFLKYVSGVFSNGMFVAAHAGYSTFNLAVLDPWDPAQVSAAMAQESGAAGTTNYVISNIQPQVGVYNGSKCVPSPQ